MSLKEKIEEDFKQSMKQGQAERLITLRALISALHNKEIELRPKEQELTDEMVIELIQREAKKRREAIEMFTQGKRTDLAAKEKKELALLDEYLPEQLSDDKIIQVVDQIVKKIGEVSQQDFGRIMSETMKQLKGQVEGNKVKEIVQKRLA